MIKKSNRRKQKEFYREMIKLILDNKLLKDDIQKQKYKLCKKYGVKKFPTNINIMLHATQKEYKELSLITKPIRTSSGVSPVAIMTKPTFCPHGKCSYCPGGPKSYYGDVPQSYTGKEPASMRAIRNNYDPYLQVFNRIEQYIILGQCPEKVELIIMGGTFPAMDEQYQKHFITYALKAMNDFSFMFFDTKGFNIKKFKKFFELPGEINSLKRKESLMSKIVSLKNNKKTNLLKEQLLNEKSKIRCVAMCIETRPDWGELKQGNFLLELGCTRIELGVQSVYDDVLKKVRRGHTTEDTKESIRILKNLGFKVAIHYMPGLPLTDKKRDIKGMKELFSNPDYRPDMIKVYPCMVAKGTSLYLDYKKGTFEPLQTKDAAEIITKFKAIVPEYCRIQRIQRDVPTKQWAKGVDVNNLRQLIKEKYKAKCRCIRCREPLNRKIDFDSLKIKTLSYKASKAKEIFISAEDTKNDILLGFARIRIPNKYLRKEIDNNTAILRELHVYGKATSIGKKGKIQHKGIGKLLMKKAEQTALKNNKRKLLVISGIGVREYYYKLGYKKEGPYLSKILN